MANTDQNNKLIIPASNDRRLLNLDLSLDLYKADHQCNAYFIENQINGICSIEFVEDQKHRWVLFGIIDRKNRIVEPNRLIDACMNLTNLLNNEEVLLCSKYGTRTTIKRKILDNEPLEIFFIDELHEDKNLPYPKATFKLTCGEFKEILMIPTYEIFYEPNKNLIKKCDELVSFGYEEDKDYKNNRLIHEFMPIDDFKLNSTIIDEVPNFGEPTDEGTPSLFKFMTNLPNLYNKFASQTVRSEPMNLAHDILIAKIDFWNVIKSRMLDYAKRMELEGAYFNVNNIWHNRADKTETSNTWDIIDSIGIVMMRLLPLLFIILLIVIIIMIVKINKNKCGYNK